MKSFTICFYLWETLVCSVSDISELESRLYHTVDRYKTKCWELGLGMSMILNVLGESERSNLS